MGPDSDREFRASGVSPMSGGIDASHIETFPALFKMQGPGVFEVTGDAAYLSPVDGQVLLWGPNMAFILNKGATFAVSVGGRYKVILPDNASVCFECGVVRSGAAPFVKTSLQEVADADAERALAAVSADVRVDVDGQLPD